MQCLRQTRRIRRPLQPNLHPIRQRLNPLIRRIVNLLRVIRIKLHILFMTACLQRHQNLLRIANRRHAHLVRQRHRQRRQRRPQRSHRWRRRQRARHHVHIDPQVRLARQADAAAHQPRHLRIQMHLPRLHRRRCLQQHRKRHPVLIPKVHQWAQRQPPRRGELHRPRRNPRRQRPRNLRWLARVARVDPIDVPVLLDR